VTAVAQWVTAVAQWAEAPGIHCYVAGSIPAVTPRYCTKKIEKNAPWSTKKQKTKKKLFNISQRRKIEIVKTISNPLQNDFTFLN
jgi:hypothetical protein